MSALVGEVAIEFNLPDTDAHMRWLSEFHRLGPLVLLFVPTVYGWRPRWQLWSVLRHYDHFVDMSTEVVIVSRDPLPELRIFQIRRGFPFIFLSDRDGRVGQNYQILPGATGALVISVGGVIRHHSVVQQGRRMSGQRLLGIVSGLRDSDRAPK